MNEKLKYFTVEALDLLLDYYDGNEEKLIEEADRWLEFGDGCGKGHDGEDLDRMDTYEFMQSYSCYYTPKEWEVDAGVEYDEDNSDQHFEYLEALLEKLATDRLILRGDNYLTLIHR